MKTYWFAERSQARAWLSGGHPLGILEYDSMSANLPASRFREPFLRKKDLGSIVEARACAWPDVSCGCPARWTDSARERLR